ncbi:hypothetical protein [Aneurinibacillus uraniidurans]|uniref:hypothetical protein n=1 Tax=Aneurinibacillus uraniidurans TaxID=2966586 RepID=UPI00234BB9B2|nr:hypothetical protein [Aneurinibacillus sp. B1]WCN39171.1 hypothetical protein PO771_07195 [Aneurinibacillus sp. B1]
MFNHQADCWSKETHKEIVRTVSGQLWRFIQNNASLSASSEEIFLELTKLSPKNFRILLDTHFILSPEVKRLVYETAPAVLNRLSKVSVREVHTKRGEIRGQIQWGRTYTARYFNGLDPSLFVYSQRSSVFDLPENRVLLFLLKQIYAISQSISDAEIEEEQLNFSDQKKQKWSYTASLLTKKCSELLRNPYIRKIGELHDLSERLIESTERVRGAMYSELALAAKNFYQYKKHPASFLKEKLSNQILEPLDRNTLYEIAVLFSVINSARNAGWTERKVSLIGSGSNIVSVLKKDGVTLKIYYQGVPKAFTRASKYSELMRKYGLSDKLRRPDIILEWEKDQIKKYCIIEVKRSKSRQYLVDGAYKLFGYLKDYENFLDTTLQPQGILVGWSGMKEPLPIQGEEVYMSSWSNLKATLNSILEHCTTQYSSI